MKYIQSFEDFTPINEAEAIEVKMLCENLPDEYDEFSDIFESVTAEGIKKRKDGVEVLMLSINGKKYGYMESPITKITVKDLAEKFAKIAKYSAWKALNWIKKNSALVLRPGEDFTEEAA